MDIALLIEKYLSDKRELVTEDDSFNIAEGSIFRWDFTNIPYPTAEELAALAPVVEAEQTAQTTLSAKIDAGKKAREACTKVLDYIAGANLDKSLTIEQITQMQQTFAQAESALRAGRPTYARMFISQIAPDGIILTEDEKAQCLALLAGY